MEVEIVQIFKRLAHNDNKCVIVVSHSTQIADEADEVIKLRKGNFEAYSNTENTENPESTENTES
jgi:putative ABC transport system ATP-binding protein